MARYELGDESNLYHSQFERMLQCGFTSCEVQVFNLLAYPMKAVSDRMGFVSSLVQRIDSWLFRIVPRAAALRSQLQFDFHQVKCATIITSLTWEL